MSAETPASLAVQRHVLREQLRAQRVVLALDLSATGGGYPRSFTMRWLIREPELVARLVGKVVGGRVAAAVPAALVLVRFLRSVSASRVR